MSDKKVTYQCCQGWGCHEKCILEAHTEDGKIVRVQRSGAIGHVGPGPQICQKGVSSWRIPYNEQRLLHPLKRVGERGEGKFIEITWDEALDEIATAINASIEKYGPKSIVSDMFYCGMPGNKSSMSDQLATRYLSAIGGSRLEYEAVDYAIVNQDSIDEGVPSVAGRFNVLNANNLIFIWGGNPIGFTRPARLTRMFLDARERGAKIVHVSNMYDNTSAKVDEWVPVKSGTDAALALGMANVIVERGDLNMDFLLNETAAAFLVRTDTGKYLRESDVVEGGAEDKFGIFDEVSGSVVFIPRVAARPAVGGGEAFVGHTRKMMIEFDGNSIYGDYAPKMECAAEIDGIACKTTFMLLREHLQSWTPEEAEKVCGVPADKIRHLANLLVDSSPALIAMGNGLRYRNATQSLRAVKLLAYLTGNHGGKDGGTVITAGVDDFEMNVMYRDMIYWPEGVPTDNAQFALTDDLFKSLDDPDHQQYKVLIFAEGNPLLNWPNKAMWREKLLPNFDLVVSLEIRMTDTCRWSDIVLPETTIFERTEVLPDLDNNIVLSEPAIEPQGEARNAADIWRGIAERTGVGQYFQKTQEEWVQLAIENREPIMAPLTAEEDPEHVGEMAQVTYERLKKNPVIHLHATEQDDPVDPLAIMPMYFTETGLIQFYSELHYEIGAAFADFEHTYITDPEIAKKYPLHLFIARHKYFMQGQFTNVPEMEALANTQFGFALNPVTAAERGLRDGDEIEVFNDRGVMRSKLQLREDVAPGVAHTWYSFDETYYPDTVTPQELATPQNDPATATPMSLVNGAKWIATQIAFGVPPITRFIAGATTPEVIFDQVCEIRKAE